MSVTSPFTIYNASAGSGKTFTLTVDYLTILLTAKDPFAFQRILAITFTNKAVGEMKSRVLDHLIAFTYVDVPEDKQALYQQVKQKTNLSDEAIAEKASQILRQLLANYASFEISTIDAFTQRIIRTFAKDLGLSTNFEIEMEAQVMLEEAIDRVIDQVGEEEQLTQVLVDFALEKTEDDKSGNISSDILEASKLLLKEQDAEVIEALQALPLHNFTAYKKELKAKKEELEGQLIDLGKQFFDVIKEHQIEASSFKGQYIPKFFTKVVKNYASLAFKAGWQIGIETTDFYNKTTPEDQKASIDAVRDQIVALFKQTKNKYYKLEYNKKVRTYITQISLLNVVQHEMTNIKTERNLVLISDFNRKISEQVKQQPAPFIYERLGERFQHYFIDEFQDTSTMQWGNLIPLTEEALVKEHPVFGKGSLSLIGDAKQSIYAWRGGDAQQFIDLSQGITPFPVKPKVEQLENNYRSEKQIVAFNNGFFTFLGKQIDVPQVQSLYPEASQESPKKQDVGKVEIEFELLKNKEEEMAFFPEKVVQTILTRMASEDVQYSDFCVLVRKKKHGIAVAKALNEREIPIISSETLLINNSIHVRFVLALLHCLQNEHNQIEAYTLFDYLATSMQLDATQKHEFLANVFQQKTIWKQINDLGFEFSANQCRALPIYDAVEYILHVFVEPTKADAYVQFFLDEVFLFTNKQTADIPSFLTYWERVKDEKSISAPEGENAVQIMTIHKSKGLQFPIVLIPFCTNKTDDTQLEKFWIPTQKPSMPYELASAKSSIYTEMSGEVAEIYQNLKHQTIFNAINLLYVAMTRAAKELYIFSKYTESKQGITFDQNSYPELLYNYLQHIGQWNEGQFKYTFGENFLLKSKDKPVKNAMQLQFQPANRNLCIATNAAFLWNDQLQEALLKGNRLHDMMADIWVKDDVVPALAKAIQKRKISEEEKEVYMAWVEKIVTHPLLSKYYEADWQTLNEQEISYNNELLRPDRIGINGNKAVIIDYKTGKPTQAHEQQINKYKLAVEDLGFDVKYQFLVYLDDHIEVVNVA